MIHALSAIALLLAGQSEAPIITEAIEPAAPPVVLADLAQLPVEEATGPRCGVAFAVIQGLQQAGDAKAKTWPDMLEANAREFFVLRMGKLMQTRKITEETVNAIVQNEVIRLSQDNYKPAHDLMPPCLLLLEQTKP